MRKRKKRTKNMYFTKIHEEAIIEYAKSDDNVVKTKLYSSLIQPAFSELVDKIVYTYKFNNLPNIDYLKDDCKVWLTTILNKYDPNRGSKAFSYFSVITKNWFIHKVKKNSQAARREINIDDAVKTSQNQFIMTNNPYERDREKREFWEALMTFVKQLENDNTVIKNDNDRKVISSVEYMLENMEKLEILNKKAIYLYLREMTGMTTKQLAPTLRKIKVEYKYFIKQWNK
tara:strand:+ start:8877 stop:9566 length:690 start_codon:yes stop_codon:yes gene_type:complete